MTTQKITVLGAGNIGRTLGGKWITAGHQVAFGVSDPNGEKAQTLRSELGNGTAIGTVAQVLSSSPDVVLMAIPGTAMDTILTQYADQLDGKIIIDATNKRGASVYNSFDALQQYTPHAHIYAPSTSTAGKISLIQTMKRVSPTSSFAELKANHE